MRLWLDEVHEIEHEFDIPEVSFEVTDNPVVAQLLGPDGEPIRQWRERPPFGYRP